MAGVWTRNYSNCLAAVFNGRQSGASHGAYYGDNNISVYDRNGQLQQPLVGNSPIISFPNATAIYGVPSGTEKMSIQFGTGTTAPSFDDKAVETPSSAFTVSQSNVTVENLKWDADTKQYSTTRKFVVQYTGSSQITITEMGLWFVDGLGYNTLVYREVFDTPITLLQYESVVLEFTQAFPIVNYEPYPT